MRALRPLCHLFFPSDCLQSRGCRILSNDIKMFSNRDAIQNSNMGEKNDSCSHCNKPTNASISPRRRFWPALLAIYSILTTILLLNLTSSFSSARSYVIDIAQGRPTRTASLYSTQASVKYNFSLTSTISAIQYRNPLQDRNRQTRLLE